MKLILINIMFFISAFGASYADVEPEEIYSPNRKVLLKVIPAEDNPQYGIYKVFRIGDNNQKALISQFKTRFLQPFINDKGTHIVDVNEFITLYDINSKDLKYWDSRKVYSRDEIMMKGERISTLLHIDKIYWENGRLVISPPHTLESARLDLERLVFNVETRLVMREEIDYSELIRKSRRKYIYAFFLVVFAGSLLAFFKRRKNKSPQ